MPTVATPLAGASFSTWVPVGILWAIVSIPVMALLSLTGAVSPPELPDADMTGQVAVVTGANTGIGRHVAAALYAKNATVILACRSPERAYKAKAEIEAAVARSDRDICVWPKAAGNSVVAGKLLVREVCLQRTKLS